ncbi:uncharacterized protein [Prorops nasuta]|uniref:uncharacterized protein n=1 Tax=Prorops nasuta TaxID=863751 RepID=UPI0034CE0885
MTIHIISMDEPAIQRFAWSTETTKLLIEAVRDNINKLGEKKCFQKRIWNKVSNIFSAKGYSINGEQCAMKWKNLKQRYKHVKKNNNQTGQNTDNWEYYDIMHEILDPMPEMNPISTASSTSGFRMNKNIVRIESNPEMDNDDPSCLNINENACRCNIDKRNVRQRSINSSKELYTNLLQQRERHHKETITIKKEFLELLKKYPCTTFREE